MKKVITFNLYKENRREYSYNKINCIYTNNTYSMLIDNVKTTFNEDQLIRENEEFKFVLNIKDKTAIYLLKEKNMTLDIKIENIKFIKKNNSIILEYKLESDEESTKIELIDKGE